jgi:hypothetical protein
MSGIEAAAELPQTTTDITYGYLQQAPEADSTHGLLSGLRRKFAGVALTCAALLSPAVGVTSEASAATNADPTVASMVNTRTVDTDPSASAITNKNAAYVPGDASLELRILCNYIRQSDGRELIIRDEYLVERGASTDGMIGSTLLWEGNLYNDPLVNFQVLGPKAAILKEFLYPDGSVKPTGSSWSVKYDVNPTADDKIGKVTSDAQAKNGLPVHLEADFTNKTQDCNLLNPNKVPQTQTTVTGDTVTPPVVFGPSVPSKLVAVNPERVLDTRNTGAISKGGTIDVDIANLPGAPAGVTAVVVNLTTIGNEAGFWTVYPSGTERPNTSFANSSNKDDVEPTSVMVPVGPNGKITIFSGPGGQLLADIQGYFVASPEGSTDGRYIQTANTRQEDTRNGEGTMAAGQVKELKVTDGNGQPIPEGNAVLLNVTAVGAETPGYFTVYPGGRTLPNASNVNYSPGDHATMANSVIVPVGPGGTVEIFSSGRSGLVVDKVASFTGQSDPKSTSGEFVALPPTRVLDTRNTKQRADLGSVAIDFSAAGFDPSRYQALSGVLTITGATNDTFGAIFTSPYQNTSTVNTKRGKDRAAGAVTGLPASVLTQSNAGKADELFDVTGAFLA